MTEPKSLEELESWMWSIARGELGKWTEARREAFAICADSVKTYLAARPASDLERRLRALAAACQLRETRALLLEAAAALAQYEATIRALCPDVDFCDEWQGNPLGRLNSEYRSAVSVANERAIRIAALERELALSREAIKLARNTELKRTEAAEARLVAGLVVAHDLMAGDDVDEIRSRLQQALAEPAQETSK